MQASDFLSVETTVKASVREMIIPNPQIVNLVSNTEKKCGRVQDKAETFVSDPDTVTHLNYCVTKDRVVRFLRLDHSIF